MYQGQSMAWGGLQAKEEAMNRWRVILGLVVVAVAGIAVAHYTGVFPPKSGLEGTIGAAKRYQATQITDKDVVLQDPQIVALLQSDLFHKVIATPEFRKLSQSDEFWQLVTTSDFRKIILLPDADGGRRIKLPDADGGRQIKLPDADGGRQIKLPDADGGRQIKLPDADGLGKFAKAHPEFNKLVHDRDFLNLVQDRNFLQLVASDQFQRLASVSDVQKVVSEASGE